MSKPQSPFDAAQEAARSFSNPLARSLVLAELAKARFASESLDAALKTIAEIPNRAEKKAVLIDLALECVEKNEIAPLAELLRQLVVTDPNSASTAGRLALSLLEQKTPNSAAALSLLETVADPFDSDRDRYAFFEKLIVVSGMDGAEALQNLSQTFTDENYRDGARLALVKFFAANNAEREAEHLATQFALPRRRSWAFFELAKQAAAEKNTARVAALLHRSSDILDSIELEPENAESLATQLRIIGQFACRVGENELGEQLLERCEDVVAQILLPMPRLRGQYFLARTLWQLGRLNDVTEYLDAKAIWNETEIQPGVQRSLVLQWSAEAKMMSQARSDWTAAIREAARRSELPGSDFTQAERVAELVRRYGAERSRSQTPIEAQGNPVLDAVNLSAGEFEDYYFSPFAFDDCGC